MNLNELLQQPLEGFELSTLLLNLVLTAILSVLLAVLYTKYGSSLSNRRSFSKTFILVSLTTLLVISVVKTSLALSLGLIGALSIVRFRAAIKEPEELAYLFIAIALGLGFGANQKLVTILAFIFIAVTIVLKRKFEISGEEYSDSVYVTLTGPVNELSVAKIEEMFSATETPHKLKRYDAQDDQMEAMYLVEIGARSIEKITESVSKLQGNIGISIMDLNTKTIVAP